MKLAYISALAVVLSVVGTAPVRAEEGQVLFHDDFATLDREWGEENDRMRNEDHKLVLLPAADRGYSALLRHPFGDADIRATVSLAEGDPAKSAGIVFWGGGYDDYYVAMFSTNGMFAVFRWENERWSIPVGRQNSDAIKQGLGQTNELRVVTQGNLATVYVNGRQVAAVRGFPPEGKSRIGLHVESGIRVKVMQAQGDTTRGGGIIFWGIDRSNYYLAAIQSDGTFNISRVMNGQWLYPTPLNRKTDAVRMGPGQTNELRLVTQGNLATFSINGRQLLAIHGYPPGGGSLLGLYADAAQSADSPSIWQFSEFRVIKPAAGGSVAGGAERRRRALFGRFRDAGSRLDSLGGSERHHPCRRP